MSKFYWRMPTWFHDMALEFRLPGFGLVMYSCYTTKLFYGSNGFWRSDATYSTTEGILLELTKHNPRYIAVPRYSVRYEYMVDGVRYESTRATSGSPYRPWMHHIYFDTMTEAEYLQAIPILRVGEPCTVFYDKRNPSGNHAALANDPCSFEHGLILFLGAFPLVFGNTLRGQVLTSWAKHFGKKRMKVRFPKWADTDPNVAGSAAAGPGASSSTPLDVIAAGTRK